MGMNKAAVQWFVPAIVALLVVPAAAASIRANPPGLLGAQQACQAKGIMLGSSDYVQCVQQQLNGTAPSAPVAGSGTPAPPLTVHRARQTCAVRGLLPGSNGFMKCVNTLLATAAHKTCTAKGLTQGSGGFARCVKQHLQAGTR